MINDTDAKHLAAAALRAARALTIELANLCPTPTSHLDDLADLRRRIAEIGGPHATTEFVLLTDALHQLALEHIRHSGPVADLVAARHAHEEELSDLGDRLAHVEADVAAIARALGLTSPP